ncbi:hypothetical protein [Brevundimonas diminuta]|uniref:hypothetical protein n=1 Tax=Brevundimonas diminuta TaxID=293 RepID=UPI0030F6E66E
MKKLILLATSTVLCACQAGEVDARQEGGAAGTKGEEAAAAAKGSSTASWDGRTPGRLQFDSATCIVMNGQVINFYAPAQAKDSIGEEPVLPQINGTQAGDGWALNIMVAQGVTHSGAGRASAATARRLELNGKLLDGASVGHGSVETVAASLVVECSEVDDLGSTP